MTARTMRSAAAAGAAGAVISILTALAVPAGLMSGDSSPTWNTIDLATDILLVTGLAGFAVSGAARGWLARIGLALAFAGLGVFALAAVVGFGNANAGESLHPISVPLTGLGMLLTGFATIRTRRWTGWPRVAPLLCGVVPFAVELPGFIAFGDSTALYFFIACTWTAWLFLFAALWSASGQPAGVTTRPGTGAATVTEPAHR